MLRVLITVKQKKENVQVKKKKALHMNVNVYSSFIHNCQNLDVL